MTTDDLSDLMRIYLSRGWLVVSLSPRRGSTVVPKLEALIYSRTRDEESPNEPQRRFKACKITEQTDSRITYACIIRAEGKAVDGRTFYMETVALMTDHGLSVFRAKAPVGCSPYDTAVENVTLAGNPLPTVVPAFMPVLSEDYE